MQFLIGIMYNRRIMNIRNKILSLILLFGVFFVPLMEAQYRYLMINTNDSTLNITNMILPASTTLNGNTILTNSSNFYPINNPSN